MTVSTHVLDAVAGLPAAGVSVGLSMLVLEPGGSWLPVEEGVTGADGRLRFAAATSGGAYRLTFATASYFAARGVATFYPEVVITFNTFTAGGAPPVHYHVPLLLSPYAYSTYRGS